MSSIDRHQASGLEPSPVSILRGHRTGVTALLFDHLGRHGSSGGGGGGSSGNTLTGRAEVRECHVAAAKEIQTAVGKKSSLHDLYDEEEEDFTSRSKGRDSSRDNDAKEDASYSSQSSSSSSLEPRIVSGSLSGELRIWDIPSRQAVVNIQGHNDSILSIQLTNQDELMTSSRDGTMKLWDISSMASSSYGAAAATGGSSSSYFSTSTSEKGLKGSYSTGARGFAKSSYDSLSGLIATASFNEYEVLFWDPRQRTPVQSLNLQNFSCGGFRRTTNSDNSNKSISSGGFGMVTQIAFDVFGSNSTENGTSTSNLLIGYENGYLAAIDCKMFLPISTCSAHENSITAIHSARMKTKDSDGDGISFESVIVTGAADCDVNISKVTVEADPVSIASSDAKNKFDNSTVAASTQPNIGAGYLSSIFGTKSSGALSSAIYDPAPTLNKVIKKIHSISIPKVGNTGTSDACVRPDCKILISSHWDKTIRIFQFKKNMKPLAVLNFHRENVSSLAYCGGTTSVGVDKTRSDGTEERLRWPYHHYFASGSSDCTIALWNLYANKD